MPRCFRFSPAPVSTRLLLLANLRSLTGALVRTRQLELQQPISLISYPSVFVKRQFTMQPPRPPLKLATARSTIQQQTLPQLMEVAVKAIKAKVAAHNKAAAMDPTIQPRKPSSSIAQPWFQ